MQFVFCNNCHFFFRMSSTSSTATTRAASVSLPLVSSGNMEAGPARWARPASESMFQPSIPMLYPHHTELGVPFSQLQQHKPLTQDWKK